MSLVPEIEKSQIVVAVRTDSPEKAYMAAAACIDGGIRCLEITFTVPDADSVIERLRARGGAYIGAGTVLSREDAKRALRAGASFVVSPNLDEEIVRFVKKEGSVSIPGASTPTEIYLAHRAGADIIKLFPFVEMGGLRFLKDIRGPFPFLKYMLCGGVTLENIGEYIASKPACILVGSSIVQSDSVAAGDWAAIRDIAESFVRKVSGLT